MDKFVKRLPVPGKHNADDESTLNLLQKQHFYIRHEWRDSTNPIIISDPICGTHFWQLTDALFCSWEKKLNKKILQIGVHQKTTFL